MEQIGAPHGLSYRTNRSFKFHKRVRLFIRVQNETLSVAVSVSNPDCSPFEIPSWDAVQTPTGLLEVVAGSLLMFPLDFARIVASH